MPFPFTFSFSVPGLHNPFLAQPGSGQTRSEGNEVAAPTHHQTSRLPPRRIPPSHSLSPPVPLARKRGWAPSTPEPSQAATNATSTRGYLDTPAKYRDMPEREPAQETEDMIAELPPAKRRRTLAGSIVSTALSAALIGTAVGLTVYRLWRDRGKEPEQLPPPPPYQPGNWVPEPPKQIEVVPPTPKNRKSRHAPTSARRIVPRHQRRPRARIQPTTPPRSVSPGYLSPPRPDLDFVHANGHVEEPEPDEQPEDEMDWIGDKLNKLIEEGQKALGREIVVMSDCKEDEVDDGSGGWEEIEPSTSNAGPSISRRGSTRSLRRTHRPRDLPFPPAYSSHPSSPPPSSSPRKRRFDTESIHHSPARTNFSALPPPSTPRRFGRGVSVESDTFAPINSSFREDESAWDSPMLRESMEKARAVYLQNRRS